MIVKSKSRLGKVVHKKTSAVLAVTSVHRKDEKDLSILCEKAKDIFNNRYSELVKTTGGQVMGQKHLAKKAILEKKRRQEVVTIDKK